MRNEVSQRLSKLLGEDRAKEVLLLAMHDAGIFELRTADDLLRLGQILETRGGLISIVGRALRTQAILRGARTGSGVFLKPEESS